MCRGASFLAQMVKASDCNEGEPGSIPGRGRSSGEGNGHPLQYSCLENSMDGGAWWATVYGVAESRTQLSNFTFTFLFLKMLDFSEVKEQRVCKWPDRTWLSVSNHELETTVAWDSQAPKGAQ